MSATYSRRRRGPKPERRRALELLAASPDGCSEAIMLAHGFTVDFLVDLIRTGMATTRTERVVAGGRAMEVARVRITEVGRRALAELDGPNPRASLSGDRDCVILEIGDRTQGIQAVMDRNGKWQFVHKDGTSY
jgi:hypothetical protein